MSPGGGLVGSEHKQHAIRTSTSEPETGKGLGDLEGSQVARLVAGFVSWHAADDWQHELSSLSMTRRTG